MKVTFRIKKKFVFDDFKKYMRDVFWTFHFYPILMTLGGVMVMVVLKEFNIAMIPFIWMLSYFGYQALLWLVFDFEIQKDLHQGDE